MKADKYYKLFSNTMVLTIGSVASKILVFFLVPFYTYCLSTSEYGVADLLTNTANFLIPFACLGITSAVFRFSADRKADPDKVLSTGVCLLGVVSVVFLLLSPILYFVPMFQGYAWLIVLYVLASNYHAIVSQFIRAQGRMRFFAIQGLCNTALVILLNLLFLLVFRMGIMGYVLSVILADFFTGTAILVGGKLYRLIHWEQIDGKLMNRMLRYSIPMIPATVFWWITNVSDRYLVTWFCGESINGIYSASYKIPTILTLLSGAFIDAWQFSSVSDTESSAARSKFFSDVYRYFIALMFLVAAFLIPLSQLISSVLFAEAYYSAWEYMPLLICSSIFTSFVSFLGSVYVVKLKSVTSFWTSFVGAATNIVLNLWLIPLYGAMGAAFATFVSYVVVFLIRSVTVKKDIPFQIYPIRTFLGTLLLLVQTVVIRYRMQYWFFIEIFLVVLMASLFAKPFLEGTFGLIKTISLRIREKKS